MKNRRFIKRLQCAKCAGRGCFEKSKYVTCDACEGKGWVEPVPLKEEVCPICAGDGVVELVECVACQACHGKGYFVKVAELRAEKVVCEGCSGVGYVVSTRCPICDGTYERELSEGEVATLLIGLCFSENADDEVLHDMTSTDEAAYALDDRVVCWGCDGVGEVYVAEDLAQCQVFGEVYIAEDLAQCQVCGGAKFISGSEVDPEMPSSSTHNELARYMMSGYWHEGGSWYTHCENCDRGAVDGRRVKCERCDGKGVYVKYREVDVTPGVTSGK